MFFFWYGYFTLNFAFLIANIHTVSTSIISTIFIFKVIFWYFLLSSNFFSCSCGRCFRLQSFAQFVFVLENFCYSLLCSCSCHSSYSWYNVGFVKVSIHASFSFLKSLSYSYLVRCSISWVTIDSLIEGLRLENFQREYTHRTPLDLPSPVFPQIGNTAGATGWTHMYPYVDMRLHCQTHTWIHRHKPYRHLY